MPSFANQKSYKSHSIVHSDIQHRPHHSPFSESHPRSPEYQRSSHMQFSTEPGPLSRSFNQARDGDRHYQHDGEVSIKSLSRAAFRMGDSPEVPVNNVRFGKKRRRSARGQQRESAGVINVGHFKRFLDYNEMQYLNEDLMLLMNSLGALDGFLDYDRFTRFFYSSLWDI